MVEDPLRTVTARHLPSGRVVQRLHIYVALVVVVVLFLGIGMV